MREKPTVRFYLARHGLTSANRGRDHASTGDEPLLPEGREQARRLAGLVKSLPVERIWTSPLHRAHETATIVASECQLPLDVEPRLREIDSGEWLEAGAPGRPDARRGDEHESIERAAERVTRALAELVARGETFLGITHLGPIRIARIELAGQDWSRFDAIMTEPGGILEFVMREGLAPRGDVASCGGAWKARPVRAEREEEER